jgi:hypothetical protein
MSQEICKKISKETNELSKTTCGLKGKDLNIFNRNTGLSPFEKYYRLHLVTHALSVLLHGRTCNIKWHMSNDRKKKSRRGEKVE